MACNRLRGEPAPHSIETVTKWELLEDGEWKEQLNISCAIRQGGIVALPSPIGLAGQIARVTYTGGYVLPDPAGSPRQFPLPGILETAAIETVTFWFQSKDAVGLRQVESINGDYREFADAEWVPWVRSTLSRFRRLTV